MARRTTRRRGPDTASEDYHQRETAKVLDALGLAWCHPPNGLRTSAVSAGAARAHGLKAGVPDVLIFSRPPCGGHRGCAIELKRPKANGHAQPIGSEGRWASSAVSDCQRAWRRRLEAEGWAVALCYGVGEVVDQLKTWGWAL